MEILWLEHHEYDGGKSVYDDYIVDYTDASLVAIAIDIEIHHSHKEKHYGKAKYCPILQAHTLEVGFCDVNDLVTNINENLSPFFRIDEYAE